MPPRSVKATRRYESPRRREQATATRMAILDAARRLFERQGYAATTMAAVAAEAGVAPKTVYVAFDGKASLLRELWHLLLRGDAEAVPMPERAWYREMLAEAAPATRLLMMAATSRRVKERAAGLMEVIRGAAAGGADPEISALWARIGSEFHAMHRPLVDGLAADGALRPGLGPEEACDILWTLNHPDVWQLLVVQRGWSPERYERWFAGAAAAELLGAPHAPGAPA